MKTAKDILHQLNIFILDNFHFYTLKKDTFCLPDKTPTTITLVAGSELLLFRPRDQLKDNILSFWEFRVYYEALIFCIFKSAYGSLNTQCDAAPLER